MFPKDEIESFEKYWRRRKPGRSTAIHYVSDATIFFNWAQQPPEAISVHQVDLFIEWQRGLGRAPATIQRRLVALRMFYDYLAYARDQDVANPVVPQRHYIDGGQPLPRDVSAEVIAQLFVAIGIHLRDRTIFTLMLHAGLRVGEVANLRVMTQCIHDWVADIRLKEQRTPYLHLNGKGQRERVVFLSASAAQLLAQYLETRPAAGSPKRVFLNRRGRHITVTGIQLQLAKYCRQAGIWLTCHQLRHTFACRLIAADVPVTSVQKLLGHASLRTTQLYIRVADSQVERDYHAGISKVIQGSLPRQAGR